VGVAEVGEAVEVGARVEGVALWVSLSVVTGGSDEVTGLGDVVVGSAFDVTVRVAVRVFVGVDAGAEVD
jgi:hypothetical protein